MAQINTLIKDKEGVKTDFQFVKERVVKIAIEQINKILSHY